MHSNMQVPTVLYVKQMHNYGSACEALAAGLRLGMSQVQTWPILYQFFVLLAFLIGDRPLAHEDGQNQKTYCSV